jgi:putative ABC transport system permease protein
MRTLKPFLAFFRKSKLEGELDDELQFHLEMRTRENIAAGMSPKEARLAALRALGNLGSLKERTRDTWGFAWLESFLQDVRYGARQLRRSPGFTLVAVITLALGIGANTAMFSVVNAVLLRPLPFRNADRLVVVDGVYPRAFVPTPQPHFEWTDWAEKANTLANFSLYRTGEINFAGEGEPDRVPAAVVSGHFFSLLGVSPLRGRSFLPTEEDVDHPFAAMVSYRLWQSRYASDPGLIGKAVQLNGKPFTVVGVMPPGFEFPARTQIWVTSSRNPFEDMFGGNAIDVGTQVACLRSGATLDQARAELGIIQQRGVPKGAGAGNPVSVTPLHEFMVGNMRPALLLLFGAISFVLLIACANVANLSFARGVGRFREVALRAALGAGRTRLVRQLLTESVLLALLGGALGLLIGVGAVQVARKLTPAQEILTRGIEIDAWVLAFTFVVAMVTGIISGLAPALQSSKLDLTEALKESAASAQAGLSVGSRFRLRSLLGVFETAAALVLLIGAGLLLHSFGKLLDVYPGFRTQNLLAARLSLLEPRYNAPEGRAAFFQDVLARVKTIPGVRDAAFVNALPFGQAGVTAIGLDVEGGPKFEPKSGAFALYLQVTQGYFQTMGIPFFRGRDFTERDTKGSPLVAIISESLARRGWPGQDPLGKRFSFAGFHGQPYEVVGVVGDVRASGLAQPPWPAMYFSGLQQPPDAAFLVVHSTRSAAVIAPFLRDAIRSVDKDEPVSSISTMEQLISQSVTEPRFRTFLLGIFAGLALALAVVGIYGVISYSVSQSTHEIGVRMALGAERADVMRLMVGQGMKMTLIGVGVGVLAAFGLTRLLASFLYAVRPTDPVTFVVVPALLIAVAFLACYIPARRATKVDPMVALRYE